MLYIVKTENKLCGGRRTRLAVQCNQHTVQSLLYTAKKKLKINLKVPGIIYKQQCVKTSKRKKRIRY